jgi:hypothetical protein
MLAIKFSGLVMTPQEQNQWKFDWALAIARTDFT